MEIKWILCSESVLHSLDFSKEVILWMAASEQRFGAILSQELDDGEHQVLDLSRKLLPKEQLVDK